MKATDKERKKLIEEALDLYAESEFIEARLRDLVKKIKELKPTKEELENDLQILIDYYS